MNRMMTVLLVDDEVTANHRLAEMLTAFPNIQVMGAATSVAEALRIIQKKMPDVVFLDMEMPEGLGLTIVPHLGPTTRVVFVTGHQKYALKAFEVGATDYLLKPVSEERLQLTIERFLPTQRATKADSSILLISDHNLNGKILIPFNGREEWIPITEIFWIEAEQNYTRIQTLNHQQIMIKRLLIDWENDLPVQHFHRLGRSLIIQTDKIRATEWQSRDRKLLFFTGTETPLIIGRTVAQRLKELLENLVDGYEPKP